MNILIHLNTFHWEDHVSQMVELVLEHEKNGDKVFITHSKDIFKFCPANQINKLKICNKCTQQQNFIFEKILKNTLKIKIEYSDKLNFMNLIKKIKSIEDFKKIHHDQILPAGKLCLSTLISYKADVFLKYYDNKKVLHALLKETLQLYDSAKKIIKDYKINQVYVWNGRRSTDGPFLYAAKKVGVTYYSYINSFNYNYFQVQKTLGVHDLNYSRKEINKLYKLRKKKFIQISKEFFQFFKFGKYRMYGKTLFSQNFNKKKINLNTKKKKLSIFTSSYWEFASLADKEWASINFYEILKKILNDKEILQKYTIIVRWHPNQKITTGFEKKEISSIIKKYSKNIIHIKSESRLNSYDLIDTSDVVLSFGGNIGVEATFYGKPSIIIGSAPYDRLNAVYVVKNLNSLKKLLKLRLTAKKKINSMKYGYFQKIFGNKKYKYLRVGKFGDYYYNNKRLKKITLKDYLKETIKKLVFKFK